MAWHGRRAVQCTDLRNARVFQDLPLEGDTAFPVSQEFCGYAGQNDSQYNK